MTHSPSEGRIEVDPDAELRARLRDKWEHREMYIPGEARDSDGYNWRRAYRQLVRDYTVGFCVEWEVRNPSRPVPYEKICREARRQAEAVITRNMNRVRGVPLDRRRSDRVELEHDAPPGLDPDPNDLVP